MGTNCFHCAQIWISSRTRCFTASRRPPRASNMRTNPARLGQPAHIDQFRVKPNTRERDFGGVHTNSGIHNRAASLILTAVDAAGRPVLTPKEVAAIFYLALTQQLSRTSGFGDSRRG